MQAQTGPVLQNIFRAVLNLTADADVTRVRQPNQPAWDSLAHAMLVAAIESEFGVQVDAADSLDLTSYEATARYLEEHGL